MTPVPQTSVLTSHPTSPSPQPTTPLSSSAASQPDPTHVPAGEGPARQADPIGSAAGDGSGFRVDAGALRGDAAAVTEFAARVIAAAARVPRADPAPRWATTSASVLAVDTTRRLLSALGHDVTETGDQVRAVAADYEEADVRAVSRLRATR